MRVGTAKASSSERGHPLNGRVDGFSMFRTDDDNFCSWLAPIVDSIGREAKAKAASSAAPPLCLLHHQQKPET